MSNINIFNPSDQDVEEEFKDQPDEIEGEATPDGGWKPNSAPPVDMPGVPVTERPKRPTVPTVQLDNEPQYDDEEVSEETEDYSDMLTDARFRLEQGRLYEMVLNHDIFDGVDADKKAIKTVQNEIRKYAQERMEIMLGMKQEVDRENNTNAFEAFSQAFPFNGLEVEALKSLAAAATKGASRDAAPMDIGPQPPAARKTLNPIGKGAGQTRPVSKQEGKKLQASPKAPVKRAKVDGAVQRILAEEGVTLEEINQVFDPNKKYLTPEEFSQLTDDQLIERNRLLSIRNKTVANPQSVPMPTPEQMEIMVTQRANQAAAHPQMKQIMGLLDEASRKKGR